MSTKSLKIEDGPSKFDLMISLFDHKKVDFSISSSSLGKVKIPFIILGLEFVNQAEKDTWELKGVIVNLENIIAKGNIYLKEGHGIKFNYNSRKRKGFVIENLSTEQNY